MSEARQWELCGERAQEDFGAHLAGLCDAPMLIYLDGDLGAGKTTLVRGFLRALGHLGAVKSPTYTLIEPYEVGADRVYHLDLYRLSSPDELEYLGLREMLAEQALILIEWPMRGRGWLPPADLSIAIEHVGTARRLSIKAAGERGEALLAGIPSDL